MDWDMEFAKHCSDDEAVITFFSASSASLR